MKTNSIVTKTDFIRTYESGNDNCIVKCLFCDSEIYQCSDFADPAAFEKVTKAMEKHISHCPWAKVQVDSTILENLLKNYVAKGLKEELAQKILQEYRHAILIQMAELYKVAIDQILDEIEM